MSRELRHLQAGGPMSGDNSALEWGLVLVYGFNQGTYIGVNMESQPGS